MSRLIDTAPERIFLCVSDDLADINRPFPEVYPEDEAITWSTNWTVAASVCYVRADLHDEAMAVLQARAGRAEDKLEEARVAELEAELRRQNEANDMIATERDVAVSSHTYWVASAHDEKKRAERAEASLAAAREVMKTALCALIYHTQQTHSTYETDAATSALHYALAGKDAT